MCKGIPNVFALNNSELGQTELVQHGIDTSNAQPTGQRVPYVMRAEVRKMVENYLSRGIIEKSKSPRASPMVLVKKTGELTLRIDYRKINSVTTKDAFPLPNVENLLLAMGSKKIFTTLDVFGLLAESHGSTGLTNSI